MLGVCAFLIWKLCFKKKDRETLKESPVNDDKKDSNGKDNESHPPGKDRSQPMDSKRIILNEVSNHSKKEVLVLDGPDHIESNFETGHKLLDSARDPGQIIGMGNYIEQLTLKHIGISGFTPLTAST